MTNERLLDPSTHTTQSHVQSDPSEAQRTASNPSVSSWVNASAGSGKTKVLTDRILRLLLPCPDGQPGTPPEKILALTFTKAGANEMAMRLSKRLSVWAVEDERTLAKDMEDNLLGRAPTSDELLSARRLFAHVADTPGGLNIMTIHSFCQSVLGRFPIEAGLPPHFKPLEEEDAAELMAEARRRVLARARTETASPLANAVNFLGQALNEEQLTALFGAMNAERRQMQGVLAASFGVEGLFARLCELYSIRPDMTGETVMEDFLSDGRNETAIRTLCTDLAASKSKTDKEKSIDLQLYWDAPSDKRGLFFGTYRRVFLTTKGEAAVNPVTKTFLQDHPEHTDIVFQEQTRLLELDSTRRAIGSAALTRDTFYLGSEIIAAYQTLKEEKGALDFDDLILRTLSLLKGETFSVKDRKDVAPWVMYKLDEGLDHILVDEAQDTNPEQWEIIQYLSEEFFSGLGAKDDTIRTMFVVGDEKQSIFSFQRAAPDKFVGMYDWFEKRIRGSGGAFTPVDINTSFRSVRTVLQAVDAVYAREETVRALTSRYLDHIAHRQGQAGTVELWPLLKSTSAEDEDDSSDTGWLLPVTIQESQSGSSKMAAQIGDRIKYWLETKQVLESHDRPIEAGDIMILVRSRGAFVGQLVRALKTRGIPVSGVDRMILSEQLVVQDFCAAAAFALLPEDDLALACLLKSPFIGYSEQRLYDLAQPRTGTLWKSALQSGDRATIEWLSHLIRDAGTLHPYEFFSRLIQEPCPADPHSGLRAIKRRLGEDALDPLDEFLNLALAYEDNHTAALQSFLRWHEDGKSEIKRQMEEGGNAVRIMTVHGSKGLQAPIVFLPDTVRNASAIRPEKILWPEKSGLPVPIINTAKDNSPDTALTAARKIQEEQDREYRRLLYVAMTRAEERLYIGGYTGKRGAPANLAYWYDDIRSAFETHPEVETIESGIIDEQGRDQPILRLQQVRTCHPDRTGKKNQTVSAEHNIKVPSYFFQQAPEEPFPPQPLVPSRPSDPEPAAASPLSSVDTYRFKRGTITHKLLQTLPDLPKDQRRIAAEKFVVRSGLGISAEIQKNIVEETIAILNDPVFAPIFGDRSMAEIPVTGFLNGKTLVSGQIDRMLVTETEVLIVDFKTNRPPPQTPDAVHPVYRQQMNAYAQVIREIYPDRKIRCALLWTDGPRLMEIPLEG